jgi:hypothetical protein
MHAAAVDNIVAAVVVVALTVMSLRLYLTLAVENYYHFENAICFDNHSQQRRVANEMNLGVGREKVSVAWRGRRERKHKLEARKSGIFKQSRPDESSAST